MRWFANLKTATKLAISFGMCLALTGALGILSLSRMAMLNNSTKVMKSDSVDGLRGMGELYTTMKQLRLYQYRQILLTDKSQLADVDKHMDENSLKTDEYIAEYEKSCNEGEDHNNVNVLKRSWDDYKKTIPVSTALINANKQKQALAYIMGKSFKDFNDVTGTLDKMMAWNVKHADELVASSEHAYNSARTITIWLMAIAMVIGVAMGLLVTRLITRTVSEVSGRINTLRSICILNLRNAVQALAKGDVTAKIETGTTLMNIDSKDELGLMAQDVDEMVKQVQATVEAFEQAQDSLSQLIGQTRGASDNIASSSAQISSGTDDLSQRTEEQASSLEETASSMEEMTSTVKQNADNARQANQLAAQAREVAEKGGAVVKNAVTSMEEINKSSKCIADIVSVIDEIAFQTNLLALNASVEAARVGEQGRGFAVVAAEVRNLAARSAAAAKEIKTLVQDSVTKVQEGSTLVNQSGQQLDEIVNSVKKVADIIAEISAASQEQASGIEQVNKAIMQMDQVTQQNASLVEESAAASQSMTQQAQTLKQLVAQFKLEGKYLNTQTIIQPATRQETAVLAATGTDGRASSAKRNRSASKPRLVVSDNEKSHSDSFEEF